MLILLVTFTIVLFLKPKNQPIDSASEVERIDRMIVDLRSQNISENLSDNSTLKDYLRSSQKTGHNPIPELKIIRSIFEQTASRIYLGTEYFNSLKLRILMSIGLAGFLKLVLSRNLQIINSVDFIFNLITSLVVFVGVFWGINPLRNDWANHSIFDQWTKLLFGKQSGNQNWDFEIQKIEKRELQTGVSYYAERLDYIHHLAIDMGRKREKILRSRLENIGVVEFMISWPVVILSNAIAFQKFLGFLNL